MNKRGQFFLVAALVIIALLLGLAVVYNSIKAPAEDLEVVDLSNEINYESAQVIQQGLNNGASEQEIEKRINDLTEIYSEANPDSDLIIIYSSLNKITKIEYTSVPSGSTAVGTSGQQQSISNRDISIIQKPTSGEDYKIFVSGIEYTFDLNDGKDFYLIIKKDKEDEKIVSR